MKVLLCAAFARDRLELRLDVTVRIKFLAAMAAGSHPFPSRTRQLSPPAPMVVGPQGPSRVGRRQNIRHEQPADLAIARAVRVFALSRPKRHAAQRGRLAAGEATSDMPVYYLIPLLLVLMSIGLTALLYWGGFVEERRNGRTQ